MSARDDGPSAGTEHKAPTDHSLRDIVFGLGALVIIATDLIGWIVAEQYYMGELMWGIAVLGLVAFLLRRSRHHALADVPRWGIPAIGLAALIIGVRLVLMDTTDDLFDRGGDPVLLATATYVGAALMAIGISRRRA